MIPPRAPSRAREQFDAWKAATGNTARDLAKMLDVTEQTVSRWFTGRLRPSWMAQLAMEHVTGRAITVDGWRQEAAP